MPVQSHPQPFSHISHRGEVAILWASLVDSNDGFTRHAPIQFGTTNSLPFMRHARVGPLLHGVWCGSSRSAVRRLRGGPDPRREVLSRMRRPGWRG